MSINTINYNKNKMIFSKLIGEKYKIKKDPYDKNILTIQFEGKDVKCKYLLFIIEKDFAKKTQPKNDVNANSLIMWSDGNPYVDQYTRDISRIIRSIMIVNKNYLINQPKQVILKSDLRDLINSLIKNQYNFLDNIGKSINCNWILTAKYNDTIEYYMITDIIYY